MFINNVKDKVATLLEKRRNESLFRKNAGLRETAPTKHPGSKKQANKVKNRAAAKRAKASRKVNR